MVEILEMMDEKQLRKLNQMDRIEYRQKKDQIDQKTEFPWGDLTFKVVVLATLFIIFAFNASFYSNTGLNFELLNSVITLGFLIVVIDFILYIGSLVHRRVLTRKLNEEYFEVVRKNDKRKS